MPTIIRAQAKRRLPAQRPSLLEAGFRGDSWVSACTHPGLLVLYLNNQPITLIPGTPLEQASLNQMLHALRHRLPRSVRFTHPT